MDAKRVHFSTLCSTSRKSTLRRTFRATEHWSLCLIKINGEYKIYPTWLPPKILEDNFPWDASWKLSPEEFLQKITIHDSYWIKMVLSFPLENSLTFVLRWDSFWNKGLLKHPGSEVSTWPILVIKILDVSNIEYSGVEYQHDSSNIISDIDVIQENDMYISEVLTIEGNRTTIFHKGDYKTICYNSDGNLIDLNK